MKLLLVEDEMLTRMGLHQRTDWAALGIDRVFLAEDGRQGLEMALRHKPEIILTDVRMPRMDGIAMAFAVRKELPFCKFVFMSGFCDKDYLKAAILLSAVNYLEKPMEPDDLHAALAQAVQKYKDEAAQRCLIEEYQQRLHLEKEEEPDVELAPAGWQPQAHMAERIRQYVQENCLNNDLSLTVLAEHFNLSKPYLCWLYKKATNSTINQLMIDCRIQWTKEYFQTHEGAKVKDVAALAGFSDSNYFIKIFKKCTGVTPADFRKSLAAEERDAPCEA